MNRLACVPVSRLNGVVWFICSAFGGKEGVRVPAAPAEEAVLFAVIRMFILCAKHIDRIVSMRLQQMYNQLMCDENGRVEWAMGGGE